MAIPFLNHLDLRSVSELQNALLHKTTTATASNVEAKIIYDTGTNSLQYYNGTTWINLDGSGDIAGVTAGDYLNGGGTSGTVTLNHDTTSRTDTTSTDAPSYGGTFQAVTSVTTNTYGHVTAIDVSTVTIPASDNTNDFLTGLSFNTGDGVLTATVQNQSNVTVDLDGRYLTGNQTITLTGEVTGSGATSISTTVANGVLDVANFNASAIVIASEGIENNDNDTTLPTSAAVKAYVDAATVGGLVYQGGYNASTNSPDLTTSPNSIEKGWTYTVTADGTFFGEQLRVGDVLIAEVDDPSALADWTTVQNNIDLASASQVGIGNVAAGTGISVSYSSGTATVTNTDTNSANTATGTITAGNTSGTVTHNFGTLNTIVQTIDSSGDTVFCEISRTTNTAVATIAAAQAGDITILVQKIG